MTHPSAEPTVLPNFSSDYTDLGHFAPTTYAFVFICQGGHIEIEAALLAASLHRFNPIDFKIIAAIPGPAGLIPQPRRETLDFLNKIGVGIFHFDNEIVARGVSSSLYTNKIYTLRVPTDADKLIFLDSDRLCLQDFWGDARFAMPVCACQESYTGASPYVGQWREIFAVANVPLPNLRCWIDEGEGRRCFSPPYFNSSLVAVDAPLAGQLSHRWEECFVQLDSADVIERRPFSEQIALGLAIFSMALPYSFLDAGYSLACWNHYLRPEQLRLKRADTQLARSLIAEHPELKRIIVENADGARWRFLLREASALEDFWVPKTSRAIQALNGKTRRGLKRLEQRATGWRFVRKQLDDLWR